VYTELTSIYYDLPKKTIICNSIIESSLLLGSDVEDVTKIIYMPPIDGLLSLAT
jgi:hypothetical protein